jgi:hypothetical protein
MIDFRAWKEKYFGYPKRDDSCARDYRVAKREV